MFSKVTLTRHKHRRFLAQKEQEYRRRCEDTSSGIRGTHQAVERRQALHGARARLHVAAGRHARRVQRVRDQGLV